MEHRKGRSPKTASRKKKAKKTAAHKGQALLNQVVNLSGIPADSIVRELKGILDKKNLAMEHLTLDQLRTVAASYLREIMGSLLDRSHPPKEPTN